MELWNRITVEEINSIITVPSAKGRRMHMKNRKEYGLSFCTNGGSIVYTQNGARYVSDYAHAVLLPRGASYLLTCPEAGDFPLINFSAPEELRIDTFVVTPLAGTEIYLRDYERLREAWLVRHDRAKALSILYDIFSRLAREERSDEQSLLSPALAYLAEHTFDPTLSTAELARAAGLSETYFRKRFRERYGTSPKQYVIELRIREASLLLTEKALSVTAVAERCGFSSVYHFCRAFKETVGVTPTEYRRRALP